VYIADRENNYIHFVSASTGTLYTIAGNGDNSYSGDGGAATAASLARPAKLAVDSSGSALTTYSGLCLLCCCFLS
jgi:hypothetical protein